MGSPGTDRRRQDKRLMRGYMKAWTARTCGRHPNLTNLVPELGIIEIIGRRDGAVLWQAQVSGQPSCSVMSCLIWPTGLSRAGRDGPSESRRGPALRCRRT